MSEENKKDMREIKFRAWDKHMNSWFQDGSGFALSWDATEIIDDNGYQHDTDDIVFQQYTGMKDLSGKEIFEGDIVRWTSTFKGAESKEHVDTIQWQNSYACFMLMPHVHEPHAAMMEVIGNIYENPELLNTPT